MSACEEDHKGVWHSQAIAMEHVDQVATGDNP